MGRFTSMVNGLTGSLSVKKGKNPENESGTEVSEAMLKEAKKNDLILRSSGVINGYKSKNFVSAISKRGKKGLNQDCMVVWEEFGCQEDMVFCGVFDGHGPWGHFVAKQVRESLPLSLLCNWQEAQISASADQEFDSGSDEKLHMFNIWKKSFLKTYADIDQELEQHQGINSFYSGSTALSIVRQGDVVFIANIGDSRAVLGTISDDGTLIPVQLTIDFKPNLPQEAGRIMNCKGRVFCLSDEPGVHRVWLPDGETPGLAMSRSFGDYCVKDYGVISVPEVSQRKITRRDQFIVLATDGLWDVISNEEAVKIVSSTPDRAKAAERLVECATRAWKYKRRGIATDDISAVCLFFHCLSPSRKASDTLFPKKAREIET